MTSWVREAATVIAVASIVLFTNLGGPKLWDRDEPRNAGCAFEMLERGDWVTPVFNAELRTHKPVLLYWLMMSAYSLFGVNEFSARFWSAFLGVGTALCTYAIGRRLFSAKAGVWAGIAIGSSLMFGVAGRAATPDSILIFCTTLSITIYVLGTFLPRSEASNEASAGGALLRRENSYFPSWIVAMAMYGVMGLGMLAKGPVGLILPTAVLGMFLLIVRLPRIAPVGRWSWLISALRVWHPVHFLKTCWSMRPITALVVSLSVAAPWYFWVGLRTNGEFLRGFFLEHNVGRAMQTMEGHDGGPLFYVGAILVGFFPWSIFAAPILIDFTKRVRCSDTEFSDGSRVGYTLAACWVGVYVTLFSIASTKLPSYVTPCYPGLALFAGNYVYQWTRQSTFGSILWRRLALGTLALVGLVIVAALPIVAREMMPGEGWLGAVGLIPLTGAILAWWCMERGNALHSAATVALTATVMLAISFGGIADRVSRHQQVDELLSIINARGPETQVASFGILEPTWVFYGKRPVTEMSASGNADWMGTWSEENGKWIRKPPLGLQELPERKDDWVIITTEQHLDRLELVLPGEFEVLTRVPYFLKDHELLLIGRRQQDSTHRVGNAERNRPL